MSAITLGIAVSSLGHDDESGHDPSSKVDLSVARPELPISRPDVLCSPSAKQVAPGSGNLRAWIQRRRTTWRSNE